MQTLLLSPGENNPSVDSRMTMRTKDRIQVPEHCEHMFNQLDTMINELGKVGVDVAYFPEEATNVLRRYAIKLTPQPGAVPTPFALYDKILETPTIKTRIENFIQNLKQKPWKA